MPGALWRCAKERMRQATNDESLGAELVKGYHADLKWDMQRNRGPKRLVDIRAEGHPAAFMNPEADGDIPMDGSNKY